MGHSRSLLFVCDHHAVVLSKRSVSTVAESLSVRFGRKRALTDVSFAWQQGVLGVTGANGSGKSTLLEACAQIVRPSSGRVVSVLERNGSVEAARIAYVPQNPTFPRSLTILDFVAYSAWLQDAGRASARLAAAAVESVGLTAERHTRLGRASGGMVRRATFAAALVTDPDLLILDEPTTGVDAEQRAVMRELISQQAAERSVILSSHIVEDLTALSDEFIILSAGRIAFFGTTAEALQLAKTDDLETAIVTIPAA
jgi:ABC-2 type transport system ATP-binding protein